MFWLKSKSEKEKIINLIKNQPDFPFAKDSLKIKLLSSLANRPQPKQDSVFNHRRLIPKYGFASALAVVAIGLTTTLAYANSSKPGDRLFLLDTWQENIALKLAPTVQTKAKLHVRFVNERALELDELSNSASDRKEQKVEAVNQSVNGLSRAIESVTMAREKTMADGNDEAAAKLDQVLIKLEDLADTNEAEMNKIRIKIGDDEELQGRLEENFKQIEQAKIKVKEERNRHKGSQNSGESSQDSEDEDDSD
ncbi:MAG: hypothetical protein HY336_02000 [Candidatus Doudnabacteria bacterium]|nr:hypothetical protein [Candidatus Doudnabacteria bacterium]